MRSSLAVTFKQVSPRYEFSQGCCYVGVGAASKGELHSKLSIAECRQQGTQTSNHIRHNDGWAASNKDSSAIAVLVIVCTHVLRLLQLHPNCMLLRRVHTRCYIGAASGMLPGLHMQVQAHVGGCCT